jgi:hypothetical protein
VFGAVGKDDGRSRGRGRGSDSGSHGENIDIKLFYLRLLVRTV